MHHGSEWREREKDSTVDRSGASAADESPLPPMVWGCERLLLLLRLWVLCSVRVWVLSFSLFFPFLSFSFCSFRFWYSGSKMAFKCCWWGDRPEWYSSFRSSGTNYFLKMGDANVRCHGGQKKMGYSSSPSSSTPKSGSWLIISQTVLLGQIFLQ